MKTQRRYFLAAVVGLLWLAAAPALAAADTVGWVTGLVGQATVERPEQGAVAASVGLGVERGDRLITGADGKMKVLFVDDTILSLGSDSRVDLTEFNFQNDKNFRHSLFSLVKGKVRVLVGKLFGIETNVKVRSPTAVAGVTGTIFILEYDPVRQATYVLTVHGAVGVSSADAALPGLFQVATGEITTVYLGKQPEQARIATRQEVEAYLEATNVPDALSLSKVPGRTGNMIDNPTAGVTQDTFPPSYSRSVSASAEGEGGAEFDAYIIQGGQGRIPDTDLPLPGDFSDGVGGVSDGPGTGGNSSKVDVDVEFKSEPEKDDKE